MTTSHADAVINSLTIAIREVSGDDAVVVRGGETLDELDIDSLDMLEVIMIVEQELAVTVQAKEFESIAKLHDIVDIFVARLEAKSEKRTRMPTLSDTAA